MTCPAGQGCTTDGKCVAACDAAKADKSSVGCYYWSVNPDTTYAAGACYAVFVANTWDQPVTLGVERTRCHVSSFMTISTST